MPHHRHNHHHQHNSNHFQLEQTSKHHPPHQNGRHHHGNGKVERQISHSSKDDNFVSKIENSFDSKLPVPKLSLSSAAIFVGFLSLVCYWNSCHGDFVFDDVEAVVGNKDLLPETPISNVFWNDFWGMPITRKESHKSYRPLTVLTFRLNYYLSNGLHPWGFHLTNVILHTAISILSLVLFSLLFTDPQAHDRSILTMFHEAPRASLLGAVLFATHPIHTEAVAGVVGRADLLCALCFITSFLLYHSSIKKDSTGIFSWPMLFLSMLLCAASMLCKEQGITVIGVCSAYDIIVINRIHPMSIIKLLFTHPRHWPWVSQSATDVNENINKNVVDHRWLRYLIQRQIVLFTCAIFLLVLRLGLMGKDMPPFLPIDNPASFADSVLIRIVNYIYIYTINAWLLVNPWWLCFDWSMGCVPLIDSITDLRPLAPVLFCTLFIMLLYKCVFHPSGEETRLLTMSLVLIIVPFLPASNLFLRVGFVIAERVLYLPSLGFCMLLVLGVSRVCQSDRYRKVVQVMLTALVAIYVLRCIHRNGEWNNERALYTSGLKVCPQNAKVHYNVAKNAGDNGRVEEAIYEYREALRLQPDYDHALNNLANIFKDRGQEVEAEQLLKKAVEIRPSFAAAWMNLGIVLTSLKKFEEAEGCFMTSLKNKHNYPDCYFNLGNLYRKIWKPSLALDAWSHAIGLMKTHGQAWGNKCILSEHIGDLNAAIAVATEGLKYVPDEPSLYFCFANVLGKLERYEEAEQHFLEAIHLSPTNPSYFGNLGVLYHRWGRFDAALQNYQKSLHIDPDNSQVMENMKKLQGKLSDVRMKETA